MSKCPYTISLSDTDREYLQKSSTYVSYQPTASVLLSSKPFQQRNIPFTFIFLISSIILVALCRSEPLLLPCKKSEQFIASLRPVTFYCLPFFLDIYIVLYIGLNNSFCPFAFSSKFHFLYEIFKNILYAIDRIK